MNISIAEKLFLVITLGGFLGITIWLMVTLRFANKNMDVMLDCLKRCPYVMNHALLAGSSSLGRLFVLGAIASVLMKPDLYLKDGGAIAEDIERFPSSLKQKIIFLHRINLGLLALVFVAGGVAYSAL